MILIGGGYSSSYSVPTLICLKQIINLFQMPLFFFLSGFCFFYSVKKHQFINRKSIIKGIINKEKRLLIPFVIVAAFWMIPIRHICKYMAWSDLNLFQIYTRVLLGEDSGHLWFLPTLFLIFIFSFMFLPRIKKKSEDMLILLVTFCGTIIAPKIPSILFLNNIASNLYWFILGFESGKYKLRNEESINSKLKYGVLMSSFIVLFLVFEQGDIVPINAIRNFTVTLLLAIGYYCISSKECSFLCNLISDESMGIYLLHSPLIYFTCAYYTNGMPFVVFINFFVYGLVSMGLTHLLRKSKLKWMIGY